MLLHFGACHVVRCHMQLLFNKQQAAQVLGISVRKIDYLIAQEQLPVRRIGRRVLISLQALEQFARGENR
jgi:excisionase family DNA binding protein